MEPEEYLQQVLKSHSVADDGDEMKNIRSTKEEVEAIINENFESSSPAIRYGGSKAKNTMIVDSYDLDMTCYFKHDDNSAGSSLEEIYNNVKNCFADSYIVEPKRSAIRLVGKDSKNDLHIDVVPGRFIDDSKTYTFLYQAEGEKCRLKTNLEEHIKHIRDSGLNDVIKMAKLWKIRNAIKLKTFILELLVVKYAQKSKDLPLSTGLTSFWQYLVDHKDNMAIEDPANPAGNDLSSELNETTKQLLGIHAKNSLDLVGLDSWKSIFGEEKTYFGDEKTAVLKTLASSFLTAPKPYWGR